jgi:hypothetical protein
LKNFGVTLKGVVGARQLCNPSGAENGVRLKVFGTLFPAFWIELELFKQVGPEHLNYRGICAKNLWAMMKEGGITLEMLNPAGSDDW